MKDEKEEERMKKNEAGKNLKIEKEWNEGVEDGSESCLPLSF